jgi:hypothetical protein
MIARIIFSLLIILSAIPVNSETIPLTTLDVEINKGVVTGAGRTVTFERIPVTDSNTGITRYYDFSAGLKVNDSNELYFDNIGSVTDVTDLVSADYIIKPGVYEDSQGYFYHVHQPTISNGFLEYTMEYIDVNNDGYYLSMNWNTSKIWSSSIVPTEEKMSVHDLMGSIAIFTGDLPTGHDFGIRSRALIKTGVNVFTATTLQYSDAAPDDLITFNYRFATLSEYNASL